MKTTISSALAYSIPQTAEILGVCPRTVASMIKDGSLYSVKIRGCRRIPKASIDRLLSKDTNSSLAPVSTEPSTPATPTMNASGTLVDRRYFDEIIGKDLIDQLEEADKIVIVKGLIVRVHLIQIFKEALK
jgi:excisionase family DNA binding protein